MIRVDRLLLGSVELSLDPSELLIVGAPIQPGVDGPRFTRRHGARSRVVTATWWPRGASLRTTARRPGARRLRSARATMLLVLRSLVPLAADASFEARSRWRIIGERTRHQGYRLDPTSAATAASLTGDPEDRRDPRTPPEHLRAFTR